MQEIKKLIEQAWEDRNLLANNEYITAVETVIERLDKGEIRVAEPIGNRWHTNDWIKKAVILYFPIRHMEEIEVGPFVFHDKMKLKTNFKEAGVRVVPHGLARYGATVGSCAQIGKHCHLSGGVGIGGVLEPVQAAPVIIEDNCFLGSRAIVVEGVHVEHEVVLGANVVLTASTKIIDVTGPKPIEYKGHVPARSVVIPGSYPKQFHAGEYHVPCALIIGKRKESTDKKTSLNDALRENNVAV
jgi:2,3,4,5-tetrahydropyridine-2-carboxylate N-succinyltransferase